MSRWLKDITIRTVEYVIASGTAVAFLKLARDPLLQWLKNHGAREIVIRKGGWSIRVKGNNDIEQAIAAMQRISEGSNDTKKRKANQTTKKNEKIERKSKGKVNTSSLEYASLLRVGPR